MAWNILYSLVIIFGELHRNNFFFSRINKANAKLCNMQYLARVGIFV